MKNYLLSSLFFLLITGFAVSQEKNELEWHTDLKTVVEISEKKDKPILMFFTGSDWCGWCKKLQAEVFYKEEFAEWAKENVVLLELDFPRSKTIPAETKQQNAMLQQEFQVGGYPTIWFVDVNSNEENKVEFNKLGKTGYVYGGPQAWIEGANQIIGNK
jgi:thioredoxin-related protein